MTIPTIYRWDDASAPTLTGTVGSLTTLLDAVLVNGYGSKAALGWAIAYTATNQRAYRAANGNRMYLSIDDTNPAPGSYGALIARCSSYETMTAATTGVNPTPSSAQRSALAITGVGDITYKSASSDTTQRPWLVIGTDTFFYLIVFQGQTTTTGMGVLGTVVPTGLWYGDLVQQQKAGDQYGTIHIGGTTSSGPNNNWPGSILGAAGNIAGHWLQRAYTQFGSGINAGKGSINRGLGTYPSGLSTDSSTPPIPDPITGGITLAEVVISEAVNGTGQNSTRGKMPGLYNMVHSNAAIAAQFNPGDTFSGSGIYAGQTFMVLPTSNSAAAAFLTNASWG